MMIESLWVISGTVSLIITPILCIFIIFIILRDQKAQHHIKELPWPSILSIHQLVLFTWAIICILYGIHFSIIDILAMSRSHDCLNIIIIIVNIFCYVLFYLWPIFMYKYQSYRLSFIVIINHFIYLIILLCLIIGLFLTENPFNKPYQDKLLFIIEVNLILYCIIYDVYLLIGHFLLLRNIQNENL